jgi:hypothetical protein
MLRPRLVRSLELDPASHPRGQPHLSAASGLVSAGRHLYVVADDEHHLGQLQADGGGPLRLVRMLPQDLPPLKEDRTRRQADLEVLALLPPGAAWPHGALFALGSGSRPQRCRGVLLVLDAQAERCQPARCIDLADLYAPLRERFGDLNIEGGFVSGAGFLLLQRANRASPVNACIRYPLAGLAGWIAHGGVPPAGEVTAVDLGTAQGVPYGFTDGCALSDGGWLFSAVAEDTADSYADGRCAASAIGEISPDGALRWMRPLADSPKVEGIAWLPDGRLGLVTDADDPGRPSQLWALEVRDLRGDAPPAANGAAPARAP